MISIDELVKEFLIFVDTSTLMHSHAKRLLLKKLSGALLNHRRKLIIPWTVVAELERHIQRDDRRKKPLASKALTILHFLRYQDLVEFRREKGDPIPDNLFLYIFTRLQTKHNLALLTQDDHLAMDILNITTSRSVKSNKRILALRTDNNGNLSQWFSAPHLAQNKPACSENKRQTVRSRKFDLVKKPLSQKEVRLPVEQTPVLGETVYSRRWGSVRLQEEIGKGGEGIIYRTNTGHVCKIYHKDRLTNHRREKLVRMTSVEIDISGICWPLDCVFNSRKEFVGYIMHSASGKPLYHVIISKPVLRDAFPQWNRSHLVTLCLTILEKIRQLHELNIIMGDINPLNILIQDEHSVQFVDTDSYQIEEFVCPVDTILFRPPEIQNADLRTFLRTFNHEYFGVATLIFMILLPGKSPYSHQGGGDPYTNIQKGDFSYPLKEKSNKMTPKGAWRFIWSNLPYRTKEAFYYCFTEHKRPSVKKWIDILRAYRYDLEKGYVTHELFPMYFKPVNRHAQETYNAKPQNTVYFECSECGHKFSVSERVEQNLGETAEKYCPDCRAIRKRKRESGDTIACVECKKTFWLSTAEKEFFEKKNLDMPKRCPDCRKKRRNTYDSKRFVVRGTTTSVSPALCEEKHATGGSVWRQIGNFWKNLGR